MASSLRAPWRRVGGCGRVIGRVGRALERPRLPGAGRVARHRPRDGPSAAGAPRRLHARSPRRRGRSRGRHLPRPRQRHRPRRTRARDTPARLSVLPLDVTDVPSIEAAAAAVAASHGRVDVILNVAAVLHVEGEMKPETSLARLDEAAALRAYRVNALGPTLVAKHFAGLLTEASRLAAEAGAAPAAVAKPPLAGEQRRRQSARRVALLPREQDGAESTHEKLRHRVRAEETPRHVPPAAPGDGRDGPSAPFRRNVPEGKLFKVNFRAERLLGIGRGQDASGHGQILRVGWRGDSVVTNAVEVVTGWHELTRLNGSVVEPYGSGDSVPRRASRSRIGREYLYLY